MDERHSKNFRVESWRYWLILVLLYLQKFPMFRKLRTLQINENDDSTPSPTITSTNDRSSRESQAVPSDHTASVSLTPSETITEASTEATASSSSNQPIKQIKGPPSNLQNQEVRRHHMYLNPRNRVS